MSARVGWTKVLFAGTLLAGLVALAPRPAMAHCDGLDGPVVTAARQSLEKGDVTGVLAWVQPNDEAEMRRAFAHALAVRSLGPQARDLADTWFFETLVRIHRAGEGAPYTGLKPAGRDLGPAIPAADRALETGDVEPLVRLLTEAVEHGVRERFAAARTARSYPAANVAAGREYVGRYVPFLHYVEEVHAAAAGPAAHREAAPAAPHPHE